MAREAIQSLVTAAAAADLSAKQFYAVTISNGTMNVSTAAKNIDGILQDKPLSGQAGLVCRDGITKAAISASANVAVDALLEVDTGGTLTTKSSGTAVAKALEASGNVAAVVYITVELLRSNAAFT